MKQLKKYLGIIIIASLVSLELSAQKKSAPYIDKDGNECVLTWNSTTGISKLFYFKGSEQKFVETPYQLPAKPTGDAGIYEFMPYVDKSGKECVLTWNSVTGTSKLFYFKGSEQKFVETTYQLPVKPTGDVGTYEFKPYIDKDGNECVLTWNPKTGTSKLFYFKASASGFVPTTYQLPIIQ